MTSQAGAVSNPFDLTGRSILVTGASSGIGRDTAVMLSQLGARVVATGRSTDQLESTRDAMTPGSHGIEPFDLGQLEGIQAWVKNLAVRYGPFTGLVHAAGVRTTTPLRTLSVDALHHAFRVNVDSGVFLTKALRQKGCHDGASSIVLLSSAAGLVGGPAIAAYAASKAALIGLTKSLAIELAAEGIRVNCIAPGMVQTGMTEQIRQRVGDEQFAALVAEHPLGLGTARDIACAAAYLLSDAARWVTGTTLVVDGGFTAH